MAQSPLTATLHSSVSVAANGIHQELYGFGVKPLVEISETNGGTATVTLEGSFDGTNWYSVGYQQIDATASPSRAASGISVSANTRHVYEVLDRSPYFRARISSPSTTPKVTVRLYALPQ
jgi:hypothetical protein